MFWSRPLAHSRDAAPPDDAALVTAVREDPQAFASLYERYLGPVYRYCYVRLGSREAAEDAASEVFLKAFAGISGYRDGVFAAWLFRIAHNVVVNSHRRRADRPLELTENAVDAAPTPEESALARAEREALAAALAALPDEQRAAIELKLAGWSGAQIAEALGKSEAAVKMLRFRGMERLRHLLADTGWDALGGPQ
ncbi:MAG: sigma-70 family RNA polymerase sigma factor [Chloroflexi bacterium]|nr:sigma-70 family RNA polymerase sigma factor [Chloroflexota bacterium]